MVNSLRNLTQTLEERKETRREVRTMLSQVNATAYAVPAARPRLPAPHELLNDGALERMTGSPLGQIAVIIALGLYAVGFVAHPPHVQDRRLEAGGRTTAWDCCSHW